MEECFLRKDREPFSRAVGAQRNALFAVRRTNLSQPLLPFLPAPIGAHPASCRSHVKRRTPAPFVRSYAGDSVASERKRRSLFRRLTANDGKSRSFVRSRNKCRWPFR